MKITTYRVRPKILEVAVQADPLHVWLTSHTLLVVRRGDKLSRVVKAVLPFFEKDMPKKEVWHMVSFWFDQGERYMRGKINAPWDRTKRTKIDKQRRYLKRSKK